jgi:hypothetical protein
VASQARHIRAEQDSRRRLRRTLKLKSGASRKRPRTLAGNVSDGAAFVLPAGHLLGVVAAQAGGERRAYRRRPALVASIHGDPHLLDEWGVPTRSLHLSSVAERRSGAMGCDPHLPSAAPCAARIASVVG